MSNKIKVWNTNSSAKPNNAIKVFEYGSTATKPNDAILVTSADNGPANAIKVNVVNDYAVDAIPVWYAGGGETPFPYKTVTIGDNVWMAENLKYDDGGEGILVSAMTINDIDYGDCYYYNKTAIQRISANFPGWHISTKDDCDLLYNEVAGDCDSLRTTSGWYNGRNGNNLKGFNAEPLGQYHNNEVFWSTGLASFFTYADNNDSRGIKIMRMNYDNNFQFINFSDLDHYPIRLVKDNL